MDKLVTQQFWEGLVPELKIAGSGSMSSVSTFGISDTKYEGIRYLFDKEGYTVIPPINWPEYVDLLPTYIDRVIAEGLPPAFIFAYDEPWEMAASIQGLANQLLGSETYILPDFWVWKVDPQKQQAGWAPHRDKGPRSLFKDKTAKSATVWIPLTNACPDNGCMYILPADRDENYLSPSLDLSSINVADIVALPAAAGSILIWNQAVTHWGGRTSKKARTARYSIAYEFQRVDVDAFNSPLLSRNKLPNFEQRLALISKQILQYRHMYPLSQKVEELAKSIVTPVKS